MTDTRKNQFSEIGELLRDRILLDLIERLDRVRDDLERTPDYELVCFRVLVDNALRAATNYLVELREERRGL
jgi:hypothetical protein